MAKRTDVELRIASKDLATKTLQGLNDELDKLDANQKKLSTTSGLASTSVAELNAQQKKLLETSKALAGQANLVEKYNAQKAALANFGEEIKKVTEKLNRLKAEQAAAAAGDKGSRQRTADIKALTSELDRLATQSAKSFTDIKKTSAALKEIGIDGREAAQGLEKINAAQVRTTELFDKTTVAIGEHSAAVRRDNEVIAEAARRNAQEIADSKRLTQALEQEISVRARRAARLRDAVSTFGGPAATESLRQAAADERILGIEQRLIAVLQRKTAAQRENLGVTIQGNALLVKQASAANSAAAAQTRYAGETRKASSALGIFNDTGRKSLSTYQRVRGQLLSIAAAYVGIYQAVGLVTSAIDVQQKRIALRTQITVANDGDQAAAAKDLIFLREEANRLGFTFDELATRYANFKISARAAGLAQSEINEAFIQGAITVRGINASVDDADGVFRAFIQILGKARVQAEELRGQLGDRLPGAVAAFAKANNLALSELDEFLKKGKGSVDTFLNFLRDYSNQFNKTLPTTTTTLTAELARLKTAYNDFLETLANAGLSDNLRQAIVELRIALSGDVGKQFVQDLGNALAAVGKIILVVVRNFNTLLSVVKVIIAFNLTKAFVSMGVEAANAIKFISGLRTALISYQAATVAATGATTLLSTSAGGLALVLGPLGILIGGMAFGLYQLATRTTEADKATEIFIRTSEDLARAQGDAAQASIDNAIAVRDNARANLEAAGTALKYAQSQLTLKKILTNPVAQTAGAFLMKGDAEEAQRVLKDQIASLNQQISIKVKFEARNRGVRQAAAEQERKDAEAAQKARAAQSTKADDAALKSAESAAEKQRKIAEQLANKKLAIEEKLKQQTDALAADIAQATADKQFATLDEVIAEIDAKIQERRTALEQLKTDAVQAKQPELASGFSDLQAQLNTLREIQVVEATRKFNAETLAANEQAINDILQSRATQLDTINTLKEIGAITEGEAQKRIAQVNAEMVPVLNDLVAKAQAFIAALGSSPEAQQAQIALDNMKAKLVGIGTTLGPVAAAFKGTASTIANGITNAVGVFAQGIAGAIKGTNSLGDAFKNAGEAFLNFAADFLIQIGQMILQQLILNALQSSFGGIFGSASAPVAHTGGIVGGSSNRKRAISPAVFAGAQRFHGGGLPGLKRDEVATILQKGEEVVTADNPRHVGNMGNGGAAATAMPNLDLSIVNAIDAASVFEAGASTRQGRRVIVNQISAARSEIKKILA